MGSTWGRNSRDFTFIMQSLRRPFYYFRYSFFMLCCLASLIIPSIAQVLEASTKTAQGCSPVERDALLAFKSSIIDPSNRLTSWNSQHDCCGWSGVVCRNDTTTACIHVVELNLGNPYIYDYWNTTLHGEKLSMSLLSLTHLESLNLSRNNFGGAQIPEFIGSFQKLRYLDLHQSDFGGTIPSQIGNLTSLHYLDLSVHWGVALSVQSLDWLTRLSSLTYLDMSLVNLYAVSHRWFSIVNILLSLQELKLSECGLDQIPSSLSHLNLTSLTTLDLSLNGFNSTSLPSWLWQLTALSYLNLDSNSFHGTIPAGIGNLSNLTKLYLSDTSLAGPLPNEIWSLTHLIELDLSFNSLTGCIPKGIGNLTSLTTLNLNTNLLTDLIPVEIGKLFNLSTIDLSSNSLKGVISQLHFANLTNLHKLDLSYNSLLTIDHNWAIPFQLQILNLNSLKVGPTFPMWLRSHNFIEELGLSNSSIEGNLPSWFWTTFSTCTTIDLSYNKLTGTLPLSLESFTKLTLLNLSSNLLEGPIPKLPTNIEGIDLSINSLSGPLLLDVSSLYHCILSYNQIHGRIPLSICNSTNLVILDLSYNQIFGEIPHCEWLGPSNLKVIHLENNNLSGKIPSSIGQLNYILSLHLNNNNLHGQIPSSLQNCTELQLLDLGNNKFSGNIPTWIGQRLQKLTVLRLRSNMFSGHIPLHIKQSSNLQIIDLANNYLTGSIPHSLGNLSAIISRSIPELFYRYYGVSTTVFPTEIGGVTIITKGSEYSFSKTLYLVKSIDLSNNSLVGEIPNELGFLAGLQTLNLSRNHLKGNIPSTIDGMKSLETLDLSHNMLSGAIPQGLSGLNSLNHLNLSYNNLSGMIPEGYQLQTLEDASIYKGNAYLCGALVNKSCSGHENSTIIYEDHEDSSNMKSVYLSTTLGFLSGIWSVFVIILFKNEWRNFYFMMIDKIYDKSFVQIKIRLGKYFGTN